MSEQLRSDLAALSRALESGLDLPATLAAACRAVATALDAEHAAAYTLSDDAAMLVRAHGHGPDVLPPATSPEPLVGEGRTLLPLVSGRRTLGCIVVEAEAGPEALTWARIVAATAAQAVEAARLWETAAAGSGTLDALTGLPSHRGFQSVLARELARARRTGQNVALCLLDLDGLGAYNERTSRADGDRILRLAAECFTRGVRSYDCVCRLGGDAFALVLPGMGAEPSATLVSRLAATFATWLPEQQRMTVSGGIAAFPQHAGGQAELVALAGSALEQAQRAGGGRISIYARPQEPAETAEPEAADDHRLGRARAASTYAGLLAGELGLDDERAERLRVAAFVYETDPGGGEAERARLAARVSAGALDAEAAEWILARERPAPERPLETRILAVAEAFVLADGHAAAAGAGKALADMWSRAEDDELDRECVQALERLLA